MQDPRGSSINISLLRKRGWKLNCIKIVKRFETKKLSYNVYLQMMRDVVDADDADDVDDQQVDTSTSKSIFSWDLKCWKRDEEEFRVFLQLWLQLKFSPHIVQCCLSLTLTTLSLSSFSLSAHEPHISLQMQLLFSPHSPRQTSSTHHPTQNYKTGQSCSAYPVSHLPPNEQLS